MAIHQKRPFGGRLIVANGDRPGVGERMANATTRPVSFSGVTEATAEGHGQLRTIGGQWNVGHANRPTLGSTSIGVQLPEDPLGANPPDHALSRLRPLVRRERRTARPARLAERARNPCLRARLRLFGWNVRFTKLFPQASGDLRRNESVRGESTRALTLPGGDAGGERRGEPHRDRSGNGLGRALPPPVPRTVSSANSSNLGGYPPLGTTTTFSTARGVVARGPVLPSIFPSESAMGSWGV